MARHLLLSNTSREYVADILLIDMKENRMENNLFDLSNQIAVITGGGKGLGQKMAFGLAGAGATVIVIGRTGIPLEQTASYIVKNGGKADFCVLDVLDETAVREFVIKTINTYKRINILINNVGIAPTTPAISISRKEWDQVMNTNVGALFHFSRLVAEHMMKEKNGNIINVASVLGSMAGHFVAHYCASKAAIIHMTRALALEWAPFNIRVNCIAPGFFKTDMTRVQQEDESQQAFLKRKIPVRRMGEPDEIIGAAVYLSSRASSYVTGSTLFVDGGYSVW